MMTAPQSPSASDHGDGILIASMATAEAAPLPDGSQAAGGGASSASDSVVIHPYLYPHPRLKVAAGQLKKQLDRLLEKGLSKQDQKEGQAFIQSLEQARSALNTALESATVSDQAVVDAAAAYLSLLLGLVTSTGKSATSGNGAATAAEASPDDALSAAEQGSSAGSPLSAPASKLRYAVRFEWADVTIAPAPGAAPRTSAHADALYELASVLVAAAVRLMHAAAAACADSATGVPTPASTRGYQLLRQAAGILDFVAGNVLPLLPAGLSVDTDLQVVRAASTLALADAQQLTMLRAIAKGNQPSLIASLAVDTADMYSHAASQLQSSQLPDAHTCKLWQYAQYKQAYCLSYAHCFNGISLWKQQDKCGAGLKSLEAAAAQLAAAKKASAAYDAAPPATLNLHHRRVDDDLDHAIWDSQKRMRKENDSVYLQPLPPEAPPLPEGKRLVGALPYTLPPPAAVVKEGVVERCFAAGPQAAAATQAPAPQTMHSAAAAPAGLAAASAGAAGGSAAEGGKDGAGQQGCSCCRFIVIILCSPILALLWLLGAVIWVLLLPLKCCCPCCGFPLQWAADLVLWLLKAPARGLLWATGGEEEGEGKKTEHGGQKK